MQNWPPSSSRTFSPCKIETFPIKHSLPIVPPSAPGTQHTTLCLYVSDCSRGLVWVDQALFVFLCLVYITEHNALKVHPCCSLCQNCLFGLNNIPFYWWTMFCFSIHPLLDTCNIYIHFSCHNICGITSESPMNQKSFTINFFLKLFIVKNIKAKKKGRIHVSFTCVQELMLYGFTLFPVCVLCVCMCLFAYICCACA